MHNNTINLTILCIYLWYHYWIKISDFENELWI